MKALAKTAFLLAALLLAGCGPGGGKPWHMTDISGAMPDLAFHMTRATDGAAVTGRDYRGQIVLLYFGYTHCPDVCPATLANLADILDRVGQKDVRVLFVTVDPDRDTVPVLKQYTAAFSPRIDGLVGSKEEIAKLARRYRIAYSVTVGPPYTVTHSSAVFVFDREGRARLVTTSTDDAAGIAGDVTRLLRQQ